MSDAVLDTMTPKLNDRISQLVAQHRLAGVAVGIVRDQELVWSAGFGFADLATERRPDEHTLFRVGSITKTFTAAALMQLRDAGKLQLDDPIVRFLPEFAAVRTRFGTVEDVTLRRLLTHRSGLMGEPPLSHWETLNFPSIAEILETLPQVEVVIEPDSAFKYSNLAFALLGEIITRLSGRPYVDYVHTEILEPLGMTSSTFELTDMLRSRMATGYNPHPYADEATPSAHPPIRGMTAAGQLYSSVHDLSKWIALQFRTETQAQGGTQVLSGRSLKEMHRVHYLEPGWDFGYCLAWMAMRRGENVSLYHGGGIHGFLTMVSFTKRQRLGVIVLTNMTGHTATFDITVEILELLSAKEKETTKTVPLSKPIPTAAEWKPFLGRYLGTLGDPIHVECRAGVLLLTTPSFPSLPPARLEPTDQAHIFLVRDGRLAGERLAFRYALDGTVIGFTAGGFAFRKCTD
jgi:D-alanyl-D-alanine carboxypeptidase